MAPGQRFAGLAAFKKHDCAGPAPRDADRITLVGLRHLYRKKAVFSVLSPHSEAVEALLWAAQQTLPQRVHRKPKQGR